MLFALMLALLGGWRATAQPITASGISGAPPTTAYQATEPVRLCGTNSSRSRRCNFGHQDCLNSGKSKKDCDKALSICRTCIDVMVACMRQTSISCATCTQRYSDCMAPWVEMMSR